MNALRWMLITTTVFAIVSVVHEWVKYDPEPKWLGYVLLAGLAVNLFYLLINGSPTARNSRLIRLFELWMDTKEGELRERSRVIRQKQEPD